MFKVGDRVRVVRDCLVATHRIYKTAIYTVEFINPLNTHYPYVLSPATPTWNTWRDDELEKVNEETNMYEKGQVIIDDDGDKRTVLGVIGDMVAVSRWDEGERDRFHEWYSVADLERCGFKLEGSEPEVKEVTMDEVAEAMGVSVENLRIKKED